MKTIKYLSILAMLFFARPGAAQQISSAELQVTGLTCSMCSQATEKSLSTLSFVKRITPDLNKNLFMLSFKDHSQVNLDQIRKKVEDAGFSVGTFSAVFKFDQVKVDGNGQAIIGTNLYKFLNVKSKTIDGEVKANVAYRTVLSDGKKTRIYHLTI